MVHFLPLLYSKAHSVDMIMRIVQCTENFLYFNCDPCSKRNEQEHGRLQFAKDGCINYSVCVCYSRSDELLYKIIAVTWSYSMLKSVVC